MNPQTNKEHQQESTKPYGSLHDVALRAMLFRIFRKFALFSDLFPKLLILKERAIMEFYTVISYRTVILD